MDYKKPNYGRLGFDPTLEILRREKKNPTIVEIGTSRCSDCADGCSTYLFAWYIKSFGGQLFSVDIAKESTDFARGYLEELGFTGDNINLVTEDGIKFLKEFEGEIDFLYLDGWDWVGSEDDKILAAVSHLSAFVRAEKKLASGALILIDDILNRETFEGKGQYLIPYLLSSKDYVFLINDYQVLFKKLK